MPNRAEIFAGPHAVPNTIAARKLNDRSVASAFSRIESSIVHSMPATLADCSSDAESMWP